MSNGGLISGAFSSDTTLTTPVAINKGGTGQITAQAALDALSAASGTLIQGDIFVVDSSLNVVRLARGDDDTTLMMNGSNPNWETVSAGGATVTVQEIAPTNNQTTTETGLTDIANCSLTLPNRTDGFAQLSLWCLLQNDSESADAHIGFYYNGADQEVGGLVTQNSSDTLTITATDNTDGGTVQGRWYVGSGTGRIKNDSGENSRMILFEVS